MPMLDSKAASLIADLRRDLGMREPTADEHAAFEAKLVGDYDPAFPKPGVFRAPVLSAAEFQRRHVVNREGRVGPDADLPAVGSFG